MQLTLHGGTAQQRAWVNEAISLCSYPLDRLTGLVIMVKWADQFPNDADTRHPYMVTSPQLDGSFLITIATWADDATNPNNQGLPNPVGDIKDFYMQGFVHELGHVVIDSTFNPGGLDEDARVQRCCGLFWKPEVDSGAGRRLGAMGDWRASGKNWPDMIREAAAEVFKCAFFTGRLVFSNRTRWNIDESNWANYLALISSGAIEFDTRTYHGSFDTLEWNQDPSVATFNPDGTIAVQNTAVSSTGIDTAGFTATPSGLLSPSDAADGSETVIRVDGYVPPEVWSVSRGFQVDAGLYFPGPNETLCASYFELPGASAERLFAIWQAPPPASSGTSGTSDPVPYPAFPFWLRLLVASGTATSEIWATDPALGGTPLATAELSIVGFALGDQVQPFLRLVVGFALTLTVGPWTCFKAGRISAPYPFGSQKGYVKPGPAAQGLIRIGG